MELEILENWNPINFKNVKDTIYINIYNTNETDIEYYKLMELKMCMFSNIWKK